MAHAELAGRVIVVVGDQAVLAAVAAAAAAAGALVARICAERETGDLLGFRADPTDAEVLARVGAHVEQRLGPIDAVVCDAVAASAAGDVFGPDLRRRGHGRVLVAAPADDPAGLLNRLDDRH